MTVRRLPLALLLVITSAAHGGAAAGEDSVRPVRIAGFEDAEELGQLSAEGLTYVRVPALNASEGHYLRAVALEETGTSVLAFEHVPADIRAFEAVTLRARVLLDPVESLRLRLVDAAGRGLEAPFLVEGEDWADLRVPLARGRAEGGFDPTQVTRLCISGCLAIELDDLEFVGGYGDWRVDGETLLEAFGERRVSRVARVRTQHFDVYTDSIAARGTFLEKLEETYEFIRGALEVRDMDSHLPVTLFQDQREFISYLARVHGWPRRAARFIAGIGDLHGFVTFFTAPQSPVVTHELTHSVFGRLVGSGGGSWLQEGAAVYVTDLHQGRSSARIFAHRLRTERYVPLAEFVTLPSIARRFEWEGRTYSPVALYEQAGALFEFLLRGPLDASEAGDGEPGLPAHVVALARGARGTSPAGIERCLGRPIAEVEQAWLRWGRRPPRR